MMNSFPKLKIRKEIQIIFLLFILWRVITIISGLIAIDFIKIASNNFLGGGLFFYVLNPIFFSWANFDGEHYLSIAIIGYKGLEQAFFPVYPKLLSLLAIFVNSSYSSQLIWSIFLGFILSNFFFLISLILLYDLIKIDFNKKIAIYTLILILVFPTSFYYGAVYSESIFLFLTILSFYLARKKQYFLSAVVGGIASGSRVFGILLLPALLIEFFSQKVTRIKYLYLAIIPVGLLIYMYYQWATVGDPLAFYRLQKIVGEQHQSGITLLPQVYYRYIKILLTTPVSSPIYQTIYLELWVGILFFILPIYGYFKRVRLSYLFFVLTAFILPTIQGSFSSVPRYVIVLFPSFLVMSIFLETLPRFYKLFIIFLALIYLTIETGLFIRGYWVA